MADTEIERTIYKLELDDSAYAEGVNNTVKNTNKLSDAQEAANKKLIELKGQQAAYKRELDSVDAVLKANEKETIELTKRLNDLKAAEKGTSVEAKNLQAQLRGITTNTKEFKIEAAALKTNLTNTTAAIKTQSVELKAAEAATGKFTGGLTKAYSGLRSLANLIPGVGIGGLVALIAGPLVNAITAWVSGLNNANNALKLLQANQANVNEVMAEANKAAGKQITDAKILYETATNVNLSMKDRLAAAKALNAEFPETFKNFTAEEIALGKAKTAYDNTTIAILAQARAKAAKSKIDELEAQQLEQAFTRQKVINATNKEIAEANKADKTTQQISGTIIEFTAEENQRIQREAVIARRDARLAQIEENKKSLQAQEDFLIKFAGLANIAKVIEDTNTKKLKEVGTKEAKQIQDDFEKRKADLIAQISALAAAEGETELKIRQQYADKLAKAELDINQDKTTTAEEKRRLIVLAEQLNYLELERALIKYNQDKAKIISDAFIKEFEERDAQDKLLLKQQLEDGAERIKAIEDEEKAKYAAMKTPVPFQGATKDPKKEELVSYANAVEKVANSVIQFWVSVNEAEAKALDYSISLQEKRVEAAQRIADRGNAEYLKQEQDRLTELNVQRENAARKQLGIDAALQASQILVGITGAIAKIATPGIGVAETITDIAVIIGALATGYGLVKSLQGNQPQLFEGTPYLQRNGAPAGRDTIPVMANEGEAVIPTDINKEYHPAVSAIYDRTIPAEELNRFVTTYHKIKPIPQLNYERIKEAAIIHIEQDGKMSVLLSENNKKLDEHIELQKLTIRYLKNMGVNVSLDQNGFAVTQMEVIEKMKRDKRI